ncbi:MAG TPA: Hsp20/alpha crystallin family protein [Candidatus Kapabacteria bacterium]|nr:Hsp20/alpha crystallin family protein [Candidatus Kapabacteria bacterium]
MTLVRWQPLRELDHVSNVMRRFFEDEGLPSFGIGSFVPKVDLSEDEKNVYVHAELPGLAKEDVKVTVSDENVLTIRGEKKREEKTEKKNYYRVERSFGEFVRSIPLPAEVKGDAIEAKYQDGILNITLPKVEPTKPKEVEVKIG